MKKPMLMKLALVQRAACAAEARSERWCGRVKEKYWWAGRRIRRPAVLGTTHLKEV